jgi:hypothetical protein
MSSTPNALHWDDPAGTRNYSIAFGCHADEPCAAIQWGGDGEPVTTVLVPRDVLYIAATQGWDDPDTWSADLD